MKILKKAIFYLAALVTLPLILVTKTSSFLGIEETYIFCAQLLSLIPGKIGSYVRVSFYHFTTSATSPECFVGFGTFFSKRNVRIGKEVSIGAYCVIGSVDIGEGTLIASKVSIPSGRHQHSIGDTAAKEDETLKIEMISIGSHCWIGENALILADIGDRSIVGGGSVVVKPIPENVTAVGNPAKVITT